MYVCPPACLVLEAQSARDHLFPISSIPDWEKARPGAASEKEGGARLAQVTLVLLHQS